MTPIERLIRTARQLLRSSWVATGAGVTAGVLLGVLVSVAIIDLVVPLWPAFRFIALLLVVLPSAALFFTGIVRPLFRRLGPTRVARTIEQQIPGIHNRLVSCVDLAASDKRSAVSPAFFQRLVSEAVERIRGFQATKVVDFVSLRRAGILAFSGVAAFLLAYGLFSDRLPTALARIFHPFQDIPPATGVRYTVSPGDKKMLRGDDILLAAEVTKGEPQGLRVEIRDERGNEPLWHDLQKEGTRWSFNLSGFEHSFDYRVHGGGTWSQKYHVTMIDRPRIVELHTVLHYPQYMAIPEPHPGPPQTADVTGPEGSSIEVVVQTAGDVAQGKIQKLKQQTKQSAVEDRPERLWFHDQIPQGAQPQGTWEWDFRLLGRNAHTDAFAEGQHGHAFQADPKGFPVQAGEFLFAYVYVMPDQKPQTIMLHWFDGAGWEHRAYWGDDKIPAGTANTASKRHMGPIPTAGEWVRLEVPAALVDVEGKTLRGMNFSMFGGKCVWHRAGALPPAYVTEQELVLDREFKMTKSSTDLWSGRLPLEGDGFYRVEFRNELGHANKPMKEAKITSIPDNPPQIVLERPSADMTLSAPAKVALVISAFDDFGLEKLVLAVQRNPMSGFESKPIKRYAKPVRSDNVVHTLDLTTMDLKMGDQIRYRVEAHDRHEQVKATQEFTIRIQDDANAADRKLATFEKSQDTFQEKLVKLIAEQAKVQESVQKMTAKYEPLSQKIKEAQALAQAKAEAEKANAPPQPAPAPNAPPPPPAPPAPAKPLELDPESAKLLEELRKELTQVAQQEEQNTQLSQQIANDLTATVAQAKALEMIPPQLNDQFQQLPQQFQQAAVQPLQNLAGEMRKGATPQQPPPNLKQLEDMGKKLQQDLERMKEKAEALANVEKNAKVNVNDALAQLKQDMLRDQASLSERELAELREFIKNLREELKQFQGEEKKLVDAALKVPEVMLPDVEKRQDDLEKKADPDLEQARNLLNAKDKVRPRRKPDFPDSPYAPENDEVLVPPAEQDTEDVAKDKADKDAKGEAKDKADKKDDADKALAKDKEKEEEPLFMPALGGPKPKLDPRFADKVRPVEKKKKAAKDKDAADNPAERNREELTARQQEKLTELQTAEQSLASDEQTLQNLLQQLREAAGAKPPMPTPPEGDPPADKAASDPGAPDQPEPNSDNPLNQELAAELQRLMQSPAMQEARDMVARMQQLRNQAAARAQAQAQQQSGKPPMPTQGAQTAAQQATVTNPAALEAALSKLDLDTRTVILKMQPRMREELLQGLKEEGPEGYQKFIRNYFQRLAKVKPEK